VILQKVREASATRIVLTSITRAWRIGHRDCEAPEGPDLIVDMGRTEGGLRSAKTTKLETYNIGERLRVRASKMVDAGEGAARIVSRGMPAWCSACSRWKVPEIYDARADSVAAREAGDDESGVMSRDKDVDPVGACVGMKGMRVQSIIRELRGKRSTSFRTAKRRGVAQKALSLRK